VIHQFVPQLSTIINTGQTRSVALTGNITDLFFSGDTKEKNPFVPLVPFLSKRYKLEKTGNKKGLIQIVYQLNRDVTAWGTGIDELSAAFKKLTEVDFYEMCKKCNGHPTVAMEFFRQLTLCVRKSNIPYNLLIIVDAADMILPQGEFQTLSLADRQRIQIAYDWFTDPEFMNGDDSVVLIAESKSQINNRISRLPQLLSVEIPSPTAEERQLFVQLWCEGHSVSCSDGFEGQLGSLSAGLSLHALRQLLCSRDLNADTVGKKVEEYIISQLGEGVVEFQRPSHTLKDVLGYTQIKKFMTEEMIPRFQADAESALPGACFAGPIGGGKTFLGEALAAELGLPVLVLKNLRSKWFGETDVIFERLRRVLMALNKVVIFVDEADTVFGGLGDDVHETEKRLTGKIQGMMSDPALRGKIMWLLMTARIHRLSADIRRPGRVGDLIVPILDPEGDDRQQFIDWVAKAIATPGCSLTNKDHQRLDEVTKGYSSASFAALRSLLKSKKVTSVDAAIAVCDDMIEPDIGAVREYQKFQALLNCTRKSLLPQSGDALPDRRRYWKKEITRLEVEERIK
jgi:hypothetical protein